MEAEAVKFPFLTSRPSPEKGYFRIIKSTLFSNAALLSQTTIVIFAIFVVFLLTRIGQPINGDNNFLQLPSSMLNYTLEIEQIRGNRLLLYRAFTSIFVLGNYVEFILVIFNLVVLMYELEFAWKLSVLFSLLAALCSNLLAVALLSGIYQGTSAVVTGLIGLLLSAFLINFSHVKAKYGSQVCIILVLPLLLLFFMLSFSNNVPAAFGFIFGFLFGLTFYPRTQEVEISPNVDKILKLITIGLVALVVLLAVLV